MQDDMIRNLLRFRHPEKTYGYLPGMGEATLAALFGLDEADYRDARRRFDQNARTAARELLEEPGVAESVDRLPFRSGETVVGVGDSFTDDLQSWLEIVRHLLELRRPHDGIRAANAGISAQTSAMALRRFVPLVSQRPDWVVCFWAGTTPPGSAPSRTSRR